MNANHKIDYIESPSKDIQKTKIFFTSLFGWEFQDFGPEYISYDDGRMKGGFYLSKQTTTSERGGVLVVFYSDELEFIRGKVTEFGGKIVKDIFSFPGGRRFHFIEPGGGEFAIWSDV